ncbi:MAG: nucleotide sugar dehydrogenase [Candidatus Bathyarchaeota archaeon]|nr:nucleotide sugar dehydrogenase [Candidatus Bathyarchaeota archaeon]
MSSALNIRKEDIDTLEKHAKYIAAIIDCGKNGIFHACSFLHIGFKVVCVDADQTIVNNLLRGKAPFLKRETELKLKNYVKTGLLSVTTDIKAAVSQSDFVILTTSVKINEKKKPDYSNIENTCKKVGSNLRKGSLVIIASTMGVGATEGLIKEILENTSGFKVGIDFGLAYSPTPILNGQVSETLPCQNRIVAALDKKSLDAASTILETITKNVVKKLGNIKIAEATVLFEAVQHDVNVALANEFALFCEKANVDYLEIVQLAKACGYSELPLPTFIVEKIEEKPYLFLETIENFDLKLRLPAIAREINEEIVKHTINLTKDALRSCGKTLRRAKVSLLGISQITNVKSPPKKIVRELVKMLEARGAKVNIYEPYLSSEELTGMQHYLKKNLTETLEKTDCTIILTGHDQFKHLNLKKMKLVMKMPAAIIDFEGMFEPYKVEKEGFIYRGLGRGVWTK